MTDRERPYTTQAPGASSHGAYAPPQGAVSPTIDDRLVAPESHAQIINDRVIRTMGANPPHATAHAEAGHVFRGCLAPGYLCAVDQLTRTSVDTDVAPDVSVYREGTTRRRARGEARGETRGLLQARRATLVLLLGHKGVALSADGRARIDACDDSVLLDRWLARVLVASSEGELFA